MIALIHITYKTKVSTDDCMQKQSLIAFRLGLPVHGLVVWLAMPHSLLWALEAIG
jgi:hypothetical protein